MNYKTTIRLLAATLLFAALTVPGCRKVEEDRNGGPVKDVPEGEFSGLRACVMDDFSAGGDLSFGGMSTKAWFKQPYVVTEGGHKDTIRGRMQEFWDNQDEVNVNGSILKAAVPPEERTLERLCKLIGQVRGNRSGSLYEGYFPKNIYQKINGEWVRSFPGVQKRETTMGGSRLKIPNAMYAEENDTILRFRNICGLLELGLRGVDGKFVKSIELRANAPLSGLYDIDVTPNEDDPEFGVKEFDAYMLDENSRDSVLLECKPTVQLKSLTDADSTLFYISLPCVTFDSLTVKVTTEDDHVYVKKFYAGVGRHITIRKNYMYSACINIDRWGIQLWKNGPVWAAKNLGATLESEPGDWFAWAAERPWYETSTVSADTAIFSSWKEDFERGYVLPNAKYHVSGTDYNKYTTANAGLKTEDDAASLAWSINWKMPTKAEFQALIDSCTWTWTDDHDGFPGYEVTSGYTEATLFLPAAGRVSGTKIMEYGTTGDYWTAETGSSSAATAARLKFTEAGGPALSDTTRAAGFSIRPIRPMDR